MGHGAWAKAIRREIIREDTKCRVGSVVELGPWQDENGEKGAANDNNKNSNGKSQQHFIVVIEGLAKFQLEKVTPIPPQITTVAHHCTALHT